MRRTVRYGLHGTAMLAWDVSDSDLEAILQYLKTFSPRWKEEVAGDPIVPSADPFGPVRRSEAELRGQKVYHGLAQCLSCHPAYATKQEIYEASRELSGANTVTFRERFDESALKDTDYTDKNEVPSADGTWRPLKELAPDFLFDVPKSVRDPTDPATAHEDLYRIMAAGVGGTAMPQWQGALAEADLWALVYYVDSLLALRGTPGAEALRLRQRATAAWTPPPAAALK